jgi:hypothetical protein
VHVFVSPVCTGTLNHVHIPRECDDYSTPKEYEAEGVRGSAARTLAGQRLVSGTVWCSTRFENMIPHPTAALFKGELDISTERERFFGDVMLHIEC